MKSKSLRWGLLALFVPVFALAQDPKAAPPSLSRLAWLAGNWRMEKAGRVVDEHWMAPAGGVMLGMARTVAKGKVVEYEFTQIREGPGGDLFYVAQPARQKEAAFKLVAQTDTDVVFENKEHDFPQTIAYSLRADGTMLAYVEGPKADGTSRRIEYAYRRAQP
jgi:hypothetical protein